MYKCPGFQPQLHIKPAVSEDIFYPRLRQENPEFEATLGYKGRLWLVFVSSPHIQCYCILQMVKYFGEGISVNSLNGGT